ncbi:MAG: hypothetical protein LUG49_01090 [Oscillospiraceae bacterium]|nr:hypothetical protein [Oscillospiraceae bacterium]
MNRYEEPMMEVIGFDGNDAMCYKATSTWQGKLPVGGNSNDDSSDS